MGAGNDRPPMACRRPAQDRWGWRGACGGRGQAAGRAPAAAPRARERVHPGGPSRRAKPFNCKRRFIEWHGRHTGRPRSRSGAIRAGPKRSMHRWPTRSSGARIPECHRGSSSIETRKSTRHRDHLGATVLARISASMGLSNQGAHGAARSATSRTRRTHVLIPFVIKKIDGRPPIEMGDAGPPLAQ